MQILLVCTANLARSPLAEAMLATSLVDHGYAVGSAGTHARSGHPAKKASQEQARLRGLDLTDHRSRPVSGDLVDEAQLVLTMAESQRDRCASMAPGAGAYVFTLSEFLRLLERVDLAAAPQEPAWRLAWVVEQAHLSRPTAPPFRGHRDVDDPIQRPWPAWETMSATLDDLCGQIVPILGGEPRWQLPAGADTGSVSDPGHRTTARRLRPRWLARSAPHRP